MDNESKDFIIVLTKGINDEVFSTGLLIAKGALTANMLVGIFLTRAAIDLVRRNEIEHTHVHPME